MPRYLVTLSIGPVQSLIGAARRTRDLWCGSWLLSEASRAAALSLHQDHPGCLIFPCPHNPADDLRPQDQPGDEANVANVIQAEIEAPDDADIRALCEQAKRAATQRIIDLGKSARQRLGGSPEDIRQDVWNAQIGDILESFAAWVRVGTSGYEDARKRLGATLAARKATRNFAPSTLPRSLHTEGLPKSSLDGAMETVLPRGARTRIRNTLGLSDGEQLDTLGVIKRLAGKVEQFTAYARIAADPWVESLASEQQCRLCKHYEPLVPQGVASRTTGNHGIYGTLPFDGQLLYPFRLEQALKEAERDDETRAHINALKSTVKEIVRARGHPVPYAVILKADGDRMGKFLSRATDAEQSRAISRRLHEFASGVPALVRHHRGHAIYAGGDDVLALVPLEHALACARELSKSFADILAEEGRRMGVPGEDSPTLSVGLGIGHIMEPLGALRVRAEQAEELAKGNDTDEPRNALGIQLGVRSGGDHTWRARWDDTCAQDGLQKLVEAYRHKKLPSRVAYDIRAIDLRLKWPRDDDDQKPEAQDMRRAEVQRTLERARIQAGEEPISSELRNLIDNQATRTPLRDLAETLIIARWLAARTANDIGERE